MFNRNRVFSATVILALALSAGVPKAQQERTITNPLLWPSSPPADCPFEPSTDIAGILFTGRRNEYTNADTWYPTWASDGAMYSPWTDGRVGNEGCDSIGEDARTGNGKIVGDDPLRLEVTSLGTEPASPLPYGGRYPCGSLVHNGIWYYGTYCLMNEDRSTKSDVTIDGQRYNWGVLGPFVGFRLSRDFGKTWTPSPHTPTRPLFPEPARPGGPLKIGAPHFVDFGRDMEHSPDGKAYLVGHGAPDRDPKPRRANLSWVTGDQIYMCRVTPAPEAIHDASQYEFLGGRGAGGEPVWTRNFARIHPLVDWNNHCGCVTMTYVAPLKKYILCITDGWPTVGTFDTYILESDRITGPWKLVTYMAKFGDEAYFVNIPSKFISADGRTAWLCYAANFAGGKSDPPGSRYGMCLQEIRLLTLKERDALAGRAASKSDER